MVEAGYLTEAQVVSARRAPATPVPTSAGTAPDWYLDWAFDEVKRIAANAPSHSVVVRLPRWFSCYCYSYFQFM